MNKFLRRLRQNSLLKGKSVKYLKYAISEIVLVVIGILIALQINTWNEERKNHEREIKLLTELRTNLQININNLENDIERQIKSAGIINDLLEHLDNKRPYHDSLPYFFNEADYAPDVVLSASAFETLKSTGLELIQTDSLRSSIINLFEVDYPSLIQETKRLEDQVWPAVVVPMYQKHFRRDKLDKVYVNDYNALLDDQEFTNMMSFRGNLRRSSTLRKQKAVLKTKNVLNLIDKELKHDSI
ncbi:DUF6090 family protein [Muriicola soli]|uniref:Uncharacterized protein n=1 Tax=Muriicola soli TaxID=2507538 RepID=A0A411E8U6_9FLAO|nr:DUF6090 family protein [Muriicola soli]QBA64068.1 hypothetical protein EQY75_05665 [Muriicola soli]